MIWRWLGTMALLAVCFAVGPIMAQEEAFSDDESNDSKIPEPTPEELRASREAASQALGVVAVLADPVLTKLGLHAENSRHAATLGEPIPVFNLNIKHLEELGHADHIHELLKRSNEMFYPIEVDGHVVSSVTVQRTDDGWEMISIGQSHLTAKLIKIHRVLELTGQHVIAVKVPSLYQKFLVNASARHPVFIPIYDVPVMQLLAMQTLGHGEWFDKIKEMANDFESALHHGHEHDADSAESTSESGD